jgi:hypothetical protein
MSDVYCKRRNKMKHFAVNVIAIALLILAGSASLVADTVPVPLCYPRPCSIK